MGLAQNVRRLRKGLGWSVARLIKESGTTSAKPIELGRIRSPREKTLSLIAKALKTTVAELYADAPRGHARLCDCERAFESPAKPDKARSKKGRRK